MTAYSCSTVAIAIAAMPSLRPIASQAFVRRRLHANARPIYGNRLRDYFSHRRNVQGDFSALQ